MISARLQLYLHIIEQADRAYGAGNQELEDDWLRLGDDVWFKMSDEERAYLSDRNLVG